MIKLSATLVAIKASLQTRDKNDFLAEQSLSPPVTHTLLWQPPHIPHRCFSQQHQTVGL